MRLIKNTNFVSEQEECLALDTLALMILGDLRERRENRSPMRTVDQVLAQAFGALGRGEVPNPRAWSEFLRKSSGIHRVEDGEA